MTNSNNIKFKVNSLKTYLEKDPEAAKDLALHYYQAFLELSSETQTLIAINKQLLTENNSSVSLPHFLPCNKH